MDSYFKYTISVALLFACWGACATTYYVRPDYSISTDGVQTDINYGAEDGSNLANAFDGFADISGLSAGDIVCLPDSSEPFYERLATGAAGTTASKITYKSCGSGKALIWSAGGLGGNCSYNSSSAATCSATYAWSTVNATLYKKRIDVRPRILWQDSTWLQPVNIDASSEGTIDSTLTAGQWGVQDNGDSTYDVYYRPSNGCTPSTCVIRTGKIEQTASVGIVNIGHSNITLQDIEIRGHNIAFSNRTLNASGVSGLTLTNVDFVRNQEAEGLTNVQNVLITGGRNSYNCSTGGFWNPSTLFAGITVRDVEYSYSLGSCYNGTGFTSGDGDGIGLGQGGGTARDIRIEASRFIGNHNAGVFSGTGESMTVTNLSIVGNWFESNTRAFGEASAAGQNVGVFEFSGNKVISNSSSDDTYATLELYHGASSRTIRVNNNLWYGNVGLAAARIHSGANNARVEVINNIFDANTCGSGSCTPLGGIYSNNQSIDTSRDIYRNNYFSLTGTNARFARLGTTNYTENSAGQSAYATASGSSGDLYGENGVATGLDANYDISSSSSLWNVGRTVFPYYGRTGKCAGSIVNIGATCANPVHYGYTLKPKRR